jgi:sulfur carrier protein ThiS
MPRVSFTPNLNRHISCPPREVSAATVRAALEAVFALNPPLRSYVLDDQGRLRGHVAVFVDAQPVRDRAALSDSLRADSEVFVVQALTGG